MRRPGARGAAGARPAAETGDAPPGRGREPAAASVTVVDSGHRRPLDLAIEVPRDELGVVATNEMWEEIYDRLAELIVAQRTTLVFVNTRRLCERVAHHLEERLGGGGGARASRQSLPAPPAARGAAAQERPVARGGRHRVARARYRHRDRRPRLPDRVAAVDRRRPAAGRPVRPPRRHAGRLPCAARGGSSPPPATS